MRRPHHPFSAPHGRWPRRPALFSETYGEVSPSGTGLHFLIEGTVGPTIVRKDSAEKLHHEARYFTVTRPPGGGDAGQDRSGAQAGRAPRSLHRRRESEALTWRQSRSKPQNPKANGHAAHLHGDTQCLRGAPCSLPADCREAGCRSAWPSRRIRRHGFDIWRGWSATAPEKFSEKDTTASGVRSSARNRHRHPVPLRQGVRLDAVQAAGPYATEASYREDVLREEPPRSAPMASGRHPSSRRRPRRPEGSPFHATEDAIAEEFAARYAKSRATVMLGAVAQMERQSLERERLKLAFHYARQLAREAECRWGSVTRQGFDCCGRSAICPSWIAAGDHQRRLGPGQFAAGNTSRHRRIRTGILAPSQTDFITKLTAVSPAPTGTPTPIWTKFLNDATRNDAELINYLQRWAGYSLPGMCPSRPWPSSAATV